MVVLLYTSIALTHPVAYITPHRFYSGATQEVTRKIAKISLDKLVVL